MTTTGLATVMLVAGGMFAGSTVSFAWSRIPIWKHMTATDFAADFSATIRFADKVQPALLALAVVSATGFAATAEGWSSLFAWAGAAGFTVVLGASVALLVPLQRRIIEAAKGQPALVDEMRPRWFRGHVGRSVVSTLALISVAVAAAI